MFLIKTCDVFVLIKEIDVANTAVMYKKALIEKRRSTATLFYLLYSSWEI